MTLDSRGTTGCALTPNTLDTNATPEFLRLYYDTAIGAVFLPDGHPPRGTLERRVQRARECMFGPEDGAANSAHLSAGALTIMAQQPYLRQLDSDLETHRLLVITAKRAAAQHRIAAARAAHKAAADLCLALAPHQDYADNMKGVRPGVIHYHVDSLQDCTPTGAGASPQGGTVSDLGGHLIDAGGAGATNLHPTIHALIVDPAQRETFLRGLAASTGNDRFTVSIPIPPGLDVPLGNADPSKVNMGNLREYFRVRPHCARTENTTVTPWLLNRWRNERSLIKIANIMNEGRGAVTAEDAAAIHAGRPTGPFYSSPWGMRARRDRLEALTGVPSQ
jgi:hypothetical protein